MARTVTQPSLDLLGTTAAVYPSEDQLWAQGPPINDAGDQGVAGPSDGGSLTPLPVPTSQQEADRTDEWLNEQLAGMTPNGAVEENVVNPTNYGPQGYGNYNAEDRYESGHTQITTSNPSAEQGWGVGPARRWAHYPIMVLDNPDRNANVHLRNGALPWVTADSSLYERSGLAWEQQFAQVKNRGPVTPVVNVPQSVPFVNTVPTYGGGDVGIPGVDYPDEAGMMMGGIY
jgi:hypothetical protein